MRLNIQGATMRAGGIRCAHEGTRASALLTSASARGESGIGVASIGSGGASLATHWDSGGLPLLKCGSGARFARHPIAGSGVPPVPATGTAVLAGWMESRRSRTSGYGSTCTARFPTVTKSTISAELARACVLTTLKSSPTPRTCNAPEKANVSTVTPSRAGTFTSTVNLSVGDAGSACW